MAEFLKFRARRGLVAIAIWFAWPPIGVVIDWFTRLSMSDSRRCSIEGCDWDPGILDLLLVFGPPLIATAWWWRARRRLARTRAAKN